MKLSKLKKQFIREAKASPKKVAILALVSAVGAWKCIPLLTGGSVETSGVQTVEQTLQATGIAMAGMQSPAIAIPGMPTWRELASWLENDPLAQVPEVIVSPEDPFGNPPPAPVRIAEVEDEDKEPPEAAAAEPTVELVLTSTAVGPLRRSALINGRVYAEGHSLDVPGAPIVIVSVRPSSVLLESNGQQTELTITPRPASGKIQFRRERALARSAASSAVDNAQNSEPAVPGL